MKKKIKIGLFAQIELKKSDCGLYKVENGI